MQAHPVDTLDGCYLHILGIGQSDLLCGFYLAKVTTSLGATQWQTSSLQLSSVCVICSCNCSIVLNSHKGLSWTVVELVWPFYINLCACLLSGQEFFSQWVIIQGSSSLTQICLFTAHLNFCISDNSLEVLGGQTKSCLQSHQTPAIILRDTKGKEEEEVG